jgi:type IV pilus assembly protein PilV
MNDVSALSTRRATCPRPASARGFTLLEVLVSILVLSIGVMGMVGLQAASLQANRDARYQSSAVRLATELGDMMRGNKDIAIQTSATANPYLIDYTGTLPSASACMTTGCTSTLAVAQSEMLAWLKRIQGSSTAPGELPTSRVKVCFDTSPYDASGLPQWACTDDGGTVVVKIGWLRSTASASAAATLNLNRPAIVMPVIPGSAE